MGGREVIRRGVHRSLRGLEDAIHRYIDTVNDDPKPSAGSGRPIPSAPASRAFAPELSTPLINKA
jgi:hypothetical protein